MTVYHTKIEVKTVCKNGSEKFGAHASCKFWTNETGEGKMEVEMYGTDKKNSQEKLITFLSNNGKCKTEEK